jgi:CHAT domain-containing protein/predicted negative regulator of RcsB-dependent stress response
MPSIPSVARARGVLLCVLWTACVLRVTAASAAVFELRPGEPRWFEGAKGTVTEIAFDVEADQFVHLEVRQDGADVAAVVLDPAGAVVREADDADVGSALESVSWTRSRSGRYTLRVTVKSAHEHGRFEVVLDPPRPAAASDDEWLRCERTFLAMLGQRRSTGPARAAIAKALRQLSADWRALGDERWEAQTQLLLGAEFYDGDSERGLDHCLEAADYAERSGDLTLDVAFSCTASHLAGLGHLEVAIQVDEELLARQRQAGDTVAARMAQLNLGLHLINTGRTSEAATHLAEALQDAEASGDRVVQAFAHAHLGRLHRERGEYQQSLDRYVRSLAIPHPYPGARAAHRAALASVQMAVGDLDAALASAQQAAAGTRGGGDARAESLAILTLGRVHAERGEIDQAVALLAKNVALCRRTGLVLSEVDGLVALGRAQAAAGRRSLARRHQEEALAQSRAHRYPVGETIALAALCALDDAEGASGGACQASFETAQAIGYGPVALLSRYYLARAARRRGEFETARSQLEAALKVVDAQRLDLRRSDLRQTFSATVDDVEDEYVDVLAELASADPTGDWDVRAFEARERARGRSLRDELAESRLGIRQGADPSLLREEDALRDRLRAAVARQQGGGVPAAAAADLERTIGVLQASLADVTARLRLASPRYASLSQPEPLGVDAVRAALLNDDSALLYYALGERRSFLWVVTRTSLERHALPARKEIERLAHRSLAAASVGRSVTRDLATLGRVLLTPAAHRLDVSRVVIVADGVLHLVPFAALPSPRAPGPLLDRSEVVHLPSASAGVLLARVSPRTAPDAVAVFADPVFRADDARVSDRSRVPSPVKMASLPRELTRDGRLARLPFTRREARAIQEHAGAGARVALDFDASRATALDERMSSYRIVHFATHGILNASRPELSGIVLSLVDSTGRPQNGFLTSLDAYNLRLDADLVVLSGCRTALGRDVRSEGIVGLTRGFMYAGARGVLATLWPVDDLATSELMRVFYAGLLGPRRLSPPAALREAQAHVRSRRAWASPYYWAAFQLQGVWASDVEGQ